MLLNGLYDVGNAQITYRNFQGEERQFNKLGDRNFTLILTEEQAEECRAIGFKVKTQAPKKIDDEPRHILKISIGFKHRPPKIVQITRSNKILLNEETIGELDFADISYVDLSIRPYYWSLANGTSGVKAYLNSMYVTLSEDSFASKYEDAPPF